MSDWFVKSDVVRHTIRHPQSGAEAEVELRPLTAGDVAVLNEIRLNAGGGGAIALGEAKLLAVERALVGWSLPQAITRDTIAQLNPLVFEEIYRLVDGGEGANGTGPPIAAATPEPQPTTEGAAESS